MKKGSAKDPVGEIRRLKDSLSQREEELKRLKDDRSFWEILFNGIREEMMVVDSGMIIKDVNSYFLDYYGLEKKDVLEKKCHKIIYGSDSPCGLGKLLCPLEKAKKTGKRVEVVHYHEKNGNETKERVRIMYPISTGGRIPELFVEITQDVTAYSNLVKKVKDSEKKFKAILDTATNAILSIDSTHKIILFNNAAERIFGYSRREILGKNLNILIPDEYGDHSRFVRRFLETKKSKVIGETLALKALKKGGEEFPIELSLSYYEMAGRITFTAIIKDVSQQKELEKKLLQTERLAAVGQTVAHVAHEIKNPLMIIGGFSYQIRKSLRDSKAIQKLDMIYDEVGRLEKLVLNLGDFIKEYKLLKRPVDINSVIQDVFKIMTELYPQDEYAFVAELDSGLEDISCDPDKLKQVFLNIIANGIEAMEDGGTITIVTRKKTNGVEIKIKDEGIGISEEDLLHIFEPFYTTRKKGSGLGLAISYKIIQAHKGEIMAVSKPSEGTSFIIRIPASY